MILRPRQEEFVSKALTALTQNGNTLGVAPTGSGKTVMLSHIASNFNTTLILQHRDELVAQNLRTFRKINPHKTVDIFNAKRKRFLTHGTTFAMVQTLCRNLTAIKPVDLLVIDESHHAAANTYLNIIQVAKEQNPNLKILGVTATPIRGDRKALKGVFDNVCDHIQITDLIRSGHLVVPRMFVIDCGFKQEIDQVREEAKRRRLAEIDMVEVEKIMDKQAVADKVIEEWKKVAGDRRTVVFCATVAHAMHVTEYFIMNGVNAATVWGDMPDKDRKRTLESFDKGDIQVMVNVAVLTEGFDSPPISCVILLRPCSHKSTMIQMIGRGLRVIDQERYPGVIKDNCIVLDFGFSLITHGSLETDINLEPKKFKDEEQKAPTMTCPFCSASIPISCRICPECGEEIPVEEKEGISDFVMCELDIINASPFQWETFFNNIVYICNGMTAWSCTVNYNKRWYAVGGKNNTGIQNSIELIGNFPDSFTALARADDFMRLHGDLENSKKSKRWLVLQPTEKQLEFLGKAGQLNFGLTRYRASCELQWKFYESKIKRIITGRIT